MANAVVVTFPANPVNGSVANISDTAAHNAIAAQAGKKIYVTMIVVGNIAATATIIQLSNLDSTNAFYIPAAASYGGGVIDMGTNPLVFAVGQPVSMQNLTNGAGVYLSAQGYAQ